MPRILPGPAAFLKIERKTNMTREESFGLILENAGDGVLVLNDKGTIVYMNPVASRVLCLENKHVGKSYIVAMADTIENPANDDFTQYLLTAVAEKDVSHKGDVNFVNRSGIRIQMHLTSSYYNADDSRGVIIQFTDITELMENRKLRMDSTVVFFTATVVASLWNFIYAIWEFANRPIPKLYMPPMLYMLGLISFFIIWRKTGFSIADMGLSTVNLKKNLCSGGVVTAIGLAVLFGLKLALMKLKPDFFAGKPFINFAAQPAWIYFYYIFSVFMQEFISQGVMHENLRRLLTGPHKDLLALIFASMLFGSMHVHYGIVYMVGGTMLLLVIGTLYAKQRSIWGILLPHFVLGNALVVLGYI